MVPNRKTEADIGKWKVEDEGEGRGLGWSQIGRRNRELENGKRNLGLDLGVPRMDLRALEGGSSCSDREPGCSGSR